MLQKLFLCFFPLALTPLLLYLQGEGYLDFGSGDKDIFFIIPWTVWSLLYLVIFVVLWLKRLATKRIVIYACSGATVALFVIWAALFFYL